MMPEPEKRIEEWLRAGAQKRREEAGTPLELHPATRQMLQDEVALTFASPPLRPASPRFALLQSLWPRLAFAGALTAVLLAMLVVFQIQKPAPDQPALARKNERHASPASFDERAVRDQDADNYGRRPAPTEEPNRPKLEIANGSAPATSPMSRATRSDSARLKNGLDSKNPDDAAKPAGQTPAPQKALAAEKKANVGGGGFGGGIAGGESASGTRALSRSGEAPSRDRPLGANRELREEFEKQRVEAAFAQAEGTKPASPPVPADPSTRRAGEAKSKQDGAGSPAQLAARGAKLNETEVARLAKVEPARRSGLADNKKGDVGGLAATPPPPPAATSTGRRLAAKELAPAENAGKSVAVYSFQNAPAPIDKSGAYALNYADALSQRGVNQVVQGDTHRQRFYSLDSRAKYRANFNSPPLPNVLTVFDVERAGDQVRIVDADGSTYEGQVVAEFDSLAVTDSEVRLQTEALQERGKDQAQKRTTWGAAGRGDAAAGGVRFRAAGTNRTLNQLVVFDANFLADTSAPPLAGAAPAPATPTSLAVRAAIVTNAITATAASVVGGPAAAPPTGVVLDELQRQSNVRLQGKALVGGTSEFKIEAVRQK